jgi:hypothetical protein
MKEWCTILDGVGNVLLYFAPRTKTYRRGKRTMRHYENVRTGAEVYLGKTGSGFYVEARHPDFELPFRKTYEWHQYTLAARDFDVLSAVVGAGREERTETLAG